jgi:hypothetical protein
MDVIIFFLNNNLTCSKTFEYFILKLTRSGFSVSWIKFFTKTWLTLNKQIFYKKFAYKQEMNIKL